MGNSNTAVRFAIVLACTFLGCSWRAVRADGADTFVLNGDFRGGIQNWEFDGGGGDVIKDPDNEADPVFRVKSDQSGWGAVFRRS